MNIYIYNACVNKDYNKNGNLGIVEDDKQDEEKEKFIYGINLCGGIVECGCNLRKYKINRFIQ